MRFSQFAQYLQKLESTPSRNEMTAILADLLKETPLADIDKVCYLVLGRLGPQYLPVEFGISEKLMMRAIGRTFNKLPDEIEKSYKEIGDLGEVASNLKTQIPAWPAGRSKLKSATQNLELGIREVFERLYLVATDSGEGSQERKIEGLAELIQQLDALSVKYLVRIPLGKLRLGFSEVTILDALSWMLKQDKSARQEIERAYVKATDIGKIAYLTKKGGLKLLEKIEIEVGTPIKPALSERLGSAGEIVKKLEKFAVEPKMDGFRVQIHINAKCKMQNAKSKLKIQKEQKEKSQNSNFLKSPNSPSNDQSSFVEDFGISQDIFVKIFSRNLEDTTAMFPEIVKAAQQLPVMSAILDGEAIAFDPKTSEFLPFQETVQRKRKYEIAQKIKEVPLKVFLFDLLYLNGTSLLQEPFAKRRQALAEILKLPKTPNFPGQTIQLTQQQIVESTDKLHEFFDLYISEGMEGVMCKKLDSPYQAGARNFNWVKFKRATEGTGLADTIDAVVMGYYAGRGARTKFGLGAFLVGVLDEKSQKFVTLAKIGTGLTEDQWQEMYDRLQPLKILYPPTGGPQTLQTPQEYLVAKELTPDQWVKPSLVVEIKADEITRSPVHTAARGSKITGSETGLALRFPRLISFRDDKDPEDATTVKEILRLFNLQK